LVYEYFVFAVFWALILSYVILTRIYTIERKALDIRAGGGKIHKNHGRRGIKYRIYLGLLIIFLVVYQISTVLFSLIMPGMLLRAGIASGLLLYFAVINIFGLVFSFFLIYFFRLWKHLKEPVQVIYRCSLFNIARNSSLILLIAGGVTYAAGLAQTFGLQLWTTNRLPDYAGLAPAVPLAILLTAIVLYSAAYIIFILRRSAFSLRQYWSSFILGYIATIAYGWIIPGQILDWNTSVLTRTKLLSWDYGYLGWIILLLAMLAVLFTTGSVLFLRVREMFVQNGKAKGLSLVYLKTGYVCLMLTAVLLAIPQIIDFF
jgi:hypothetical protein